MSWSVKTLKPSAPAARSPSAWGPRGSAPATIPARLTFEKVSHGFGDTQVLKDFSLDVAPGEIVCLLGPSGCGKTTLLRLAAGIERLDQGRILIDDTVVSGPTAFVPPERRGVGLVFQDFALFPHLTIFENVAFGLRRLPAAEAKSAAMAALQRVGLAAMAEAYPHVLSGGEQQRVALARALVPRPNVLLLDEPFSGLDKRLREEMREETLSILRETRTTCVMVTHDPEEAMRMGDRIAVMRRGQLVQLGPAEALYENPADVFVARLFSEINEIPCVVKNGKLCLGIADFFGDLSNVDLPENGSVILGIRQQDLVITDAHSPDHEAMLSQTYPKSLPGRVLSVKFLGDFALIEIAVDGLDLPLMARTTQCEAPPVGRNVTVSVEPEDVQAFSADDLDDLKN